MNNAMKILPLVIVFLVALAMPVYADGITPITPDDPQFSNDIFQNKYMKIHFNQGADYIYDTETEEVVFETLSYNLKNSTGYVGYSTGSVFECLNNTDCIEKEKNCYENSKLDINYKMLKDGTVKMLIELEAGAEDDYKLEYTIITSKQYEIFNNSNYAIIGGIKYDWSDVFGSYENNITDNGNGFTHEIDLGHLEIGEKLEIDPLIVPATTVDNYEETTLFKDNTTGYFYFLTRNTTDRLLYRSIDEGVTWNLYSTNNTDFYNNGRVSGVITREQMMIHDFDFTTGWSTSGGASISQNTTFKKEGIASLNFYDSSGTSVNPYIYKNVVSTNLTNRTGYMWLYVENKSAYIEQSSSPIRIWVSSDGPKVLTGKLPDEELFVIT